MLEELVASRRKTFNRPLMSTTLGSATIHGALLAAAIWLPGNPSADTVPVVETDTTMIYVPRPRPETPQRQPDDMVAPVAPVLRRPPVLHHPIVVPTEIPPINLSDPFDVDEFKRFAARAVSNVVGVGAGGNDGEPSSGVFRMLDLDVPPERLSGPRARYPEMLRRIAVSGRVEVQFVIDTTGAVEASSVQILSSTHSAFEAPALTAVLGAVYRPGEVNGVRVRVLVRQVVAFSMR